ncbi:uncharacterized protein LOC144707328 [Wolffia australiana]
METADAQHGDGGGYVLEMEELGLIADSKALFLSRKSSLKDDRAAAADDGITILASKFVEAPPIVASVSPQHVRRSHVRRAVAPWLFPRNVFVFFATLSSMGTILLLYFTLSIGKMGDGDMDSR